MTAPTAITNFFPVIKRARIAATAAASTAALTTAAASSSSSEERDDATTATTTATKEDVSPPVSSLLPPSDFLAPAVASVTDLRWRKLIQSELVEKPYGKSLTTFLNSRAKQYKKTIFPPQPLIFNAFALCPFERVKVVIIGQDPYHGDGQAHGLCFSVPKGVPPPPSLRNIIKEITTDLNLRVRTDMGCLEALAQQGVLLLNALLTVERGEPMSHARQGWERFTDEAIRLVSREKQNTVFMLWGKPAQEKGASVDRSKHLVLTSSHPSPLGATKTSEPFIGSRHFSKCNQYLKSKGLDEIDWSAPFR